MHQLSVKDTVSLVSSIPFVSYSLSVSYSAQLPEACKEGFDEDILLRTELSRVSVDCPVVGLRVSFCLMEEEVSQMMSDRH